MLHFATGRRAVRAVDRSGYHALTQRRPYWTTVKKEHVLNIHHFAAVVVAVFGAAQAHAGAPPALEVFGSLAGAPTFDRPQPNGNNAPTEIDNFGKGVSYQTTQFTVSQAGQYTLVLSSGFDSVLGLHANAFNPADPLATAVIYGDDFDNQDGGFFVNLSTSVQYFAVATSYSAGSVGAYTLSFYGPGDVILTSTAGAVPEPASWAMMITGFGLVGAAARRRGAAARAVG